MQFSDIVAPLAFSTFMSEYWEKKHLYIPGNSTNKFRQILNVDEIDKFLSRSDIRHPSLRIVQNGNEHDLGSYTKEFELGAHRSHDQIDNEKMFALYSAGATIVLQHLQHNIPGLGIFTNSLEEKFGCNVHASSFITPPAAQGFTSHYDTYSFFALQISGLKKWSIYPKTPLSPVREDRLTDKSWVPCDPIAVVTLKAGDFLYVPRGWFHSAESATETSIHLTFGFFLPTLLDIFQAAIKDMYKFEESRKTPSPIESNGRLTLDKQELSAFKDFLIRNIDLNAGYESLQQKFSMRRIDNRNGRLADLIRLKEIDLGSVIAVRSDLPSKYRVVKSGEKIILHFSDKEIIFPAVVLETIELIESSGGITIGSINDRIDSESRLILSKKLIEEGFLRIVSV